MSTDLLCFGNPLLDMVLPVTDGTLLTKYGLLPDNQIEAAPEQKPLFDEVFNSEGVTFSPGGSAQNTARFYRWALGERGRVAFVGCVGADKFGQRLEELVQRDGVDTRYIRHPSEPTGRSVNLVSAANRSLVADIAAANFCRPDQAFTPHNLALLTSATYVYVESMVDVPQRQLQRLWLRRQGFFVTHDPETAVQVARFCSESGRQLVFSLSGTYVCQQHTGAICHLLPHCSYLFGHITEYQALARAVGLREGEFEVSPLGFCQLTEAAEGKRRTLEAMTRPDGEPAPPLLPDNRDAPCLRMVVTQSADPVVMLDAMSAVVLPVPPISPDSIVDTTGAGDAVVAGFLAGCHLDRQPEDCLRLGVMAAREVIQVLGCPVPSRAHPLLDTSEAESTPN